MASRRRVDYFMVSPKPGLPLRGLWETLPLIAEDLGAGS
jgi:hypothetical protein